MWHNTQTDFAAALLDRTRAVPYGITSNGGRLDIYKNTVAVGLGQTLAEIYPVVRALVGADFFNAMAHVYFQKNRPASPVLSEYGRSFGDFIDTFDPAKNVPYLADVARLERAWLDAWHAADCLPIGIENLALINESAVDDLRITLHPSVSLLESTGPHVSIWQAHQNNQMADLSSISNTPEYALVVRPALDVHVISLTKQAYLFSEKLSQGARLGAVCDAMSEIDGFDPSTHLAALFTVGAITALHHTDTTGGESIS